MQNFQFKSLWNHKWNPARNRKRTLITVLAIGALFGVVALAAMNATATPRSPEQVKPLLDEVEGGAPRVKEWRHQGLEAPPKD